MARHPEVTEKEIIQAGKELARKGKVPNPGAIRAQLGYKGGLLRIKNIWEAHLKATNSELLPKQDKKTSLESLPEGYVNQVSYLMEQVSTALENLAVEAFNSSQSEFERRLKLIETRNSEKEVYFESAEASANDSIDRLEQEITLLNQELKELAEQNAQLLVTNSTLTGRLSVFESLKHSHRITNEEMNDV